MWKPRGGDGDGGGGGGGVAGGGGRAVEMAVLKARVMRVTNTAVMVVVTVQAIKAGVMIMAVVAAAVDIGAHYITAGKK